MTVQNETTLVMACQVCPLRRDTPSELINGTGSPMHRIDKELCRPATAVLSSDHAEDSSKSAPAAHVETRVLLQSLGGGVHFILFLLY